MMAGYQHTGMEVHDGYAAHSHEVRPDHRGVARVRTRDLPRLPTDDLVLHGDQIDVMHLERLGPDRWLLLVSLAGGGTMRVTLATADGGHLDAVQSSSRRGGDPAVLRGADTP